MGYNSTYKGAEIQAKLEKIDQLNAGMEDTDETVEDVDIPPYVKFVEQELTDEQKEQARKNIGVDGVSGSTPVVDHGTSDTIFTLTPNVFHIWGEVDSLNLSLGEEQDEVMNEYMFQFTSGSTPTTLSVPSTVKWVAEPNIEANKTYQVSIVNNIGIIAGV